MTAAPLGAFIAAIGLAPAAGASPAIALSWLLFTGSSVHVASTGWLFAFPEVRRHASQHRTRYLLVPTALVLSGALVAIMVSPRDLAWPLLGYFGWQFFHYQKQNLGVAALAAASQRVASLTRAERMLIGISGWSAIAALMLRPGLLQLALDPQLSWYPAVPFALVSALFAITVATGLAMLLRRSPADRPPAFALTYLAAIAFPLPIFVFTSPYAAVGGMTIAHGLQYLLLVAMVAAGPVEKRASWSHLTVLGSAAIVGGVALSLASHLHSGGPVAHGIYGAYLGVVMSHFVVDAGLWRLREPFPRRFLSGRIPAVLGLFPSPVPDASAGGVR